MQERFRCGVETPMEPNPEFLALDEQTSRIVRGGMPHPSMNRYSFVQDGSPQRRRDALIHALLPRLALVLPTPYWCFVWTYSEQRGRIRFGVTRSQRQKEGWLVCTDQSVGVAIRPWSPEAANALSPAGCLEAHGGTTCILAGGPATPASLLEAPARPSVAMAGHAGHWMPSDGFVRWLSHGGMSIAYLTGLSAESGAGLWLLTPLRLDLSALLSDGTVLPPCLGREAASIWQP